MGKQHQDGGAEEKWDECVLLSDKICISKY